MTARDTSELLYDSEAALRLVDSAIEDLRDVDGRPGSNAGESAAAAGGRLDAVERALAVLDQLEARSAEGDAPGAAALRRALRGELLRLVGSAGPR